jgi:hypothetical protein
LRVNVSLAATLQRRHAEIKHMFECSGRGARDLLENGHMFDRTHVRSNTFEAMCEEEQEKEQCAKTREGRTHVDTDVDSPHEPEAKPEAKRGAELESELEYDRIGAPAARGRERDGCAT